MPNIERHFSGKLNLDTQAYRVPSSDWVDALNITRDAQGDGQDEVVSNIVGNTLVPYSKPNTDIWKKIGHFEDKARNRLYAFIWNRSLHHTVSYFDKTTLSIVRVMENITDTGGIDVLGFHPSYRINHVDIIHRPEGDLMYWTDNLNPPSNINVDKAVAGGYGVITRSYLDVAKDMPNDAPKVVYENDADVTVNNLKNSLFQFAQTWVYENFEVTPYSTASEVPLPFMPQNQPTDTDPTQNARIAIYLNTGDATVKKIRVAFKQTKNGATSNYFALNDLVKADLGIPDNSIYRYVFYNNEVPTPVDVKTGSRIFDWVPFIADTQSLANGNSLVYGNFTEGYDPVIPIFDSIATNSVLPYNSYNGVLFFGFQNSSTQITLYLTGMGTNDGSGNAAVLDNPPEHMYVTAKTPAGVIKNFQYDPINGTIAVILAGLATGAVAAGFTIVSTGTNTLVIQLAGGVVYDSAGVLRIIGTFNPDDVMFAYANSANYQFGVVYFDAKGRTNQVVTSAGFKVKTNATGIPVITLQISSRPPIWAVSYHIVRSNDLTYNRRFFWISNSAYNQFSNTTNLTYAYIGIDNITDFNLSISAATPVVGYEFVQGDRITFNSRITFYGAETNLSNKDYEILGIENNILINGQIKEGRYIKFLYPAADIDFNFKLDGTFDFQNYKIFIYNYKEHTADNLSVYYEFGKNFPIGNAGTVNAYHIAQDQTQTPDLATPALIQFAEGDYFYRKRVVPIGNPYYYNLIGYEDGLADYTLIPIEVDSTPFTTPYYKFARETFRICGDGVGQPPFAADTDAIFQNLSTVPIRLRIRATLTFTNDVLVTDFYIKAKMVNNPVPVAAVVLYDIIQSTGALVVGAAHVIEIDTVVTVYQGSKLFLQLFKHGSKIWVQSTKFRFDVLNNFPIYITENSFSDVYAIRTNSNSRPFVVDKNAKRTQFPASQRFSLEFQEDTNINQTNVFYFDNAVTHDRNFGEIRKTFIVGRRMFIFHQFETGVVPVLTQVIRDTKDNPLEANSDILLNKITYPYEGKYGIGDTPESFAYAKGAMYFMDSNKGVPVRLAQDGMIPLSIKYDTNAFFVAKVAAFKDQLNNGIGSVIHPFIGNPTIYGVFDQYTNKYIIALEEINRYNEELFLTFHQDPYTICFLEARTEKEGFEAFYSYAPEGMATLDNTLVTFKNGDYYTHDSTTFCNFYGVQYGCSITAIFNDHSVQKKTWKTMMQLGNIIWNCPAIESQMISYGTTPQQSNLIDADFEVLESNYHAAFLNDINSIGGLIEGDNLKGNYLIVKFARASAPNLVILNGAIVRYIDSPLTTK